MRQFILVAAAGIALTSSVVGQQPTTSHASREAVIAFLHGEGILAGKTRVKELSWNANAKWWFVSLEHLGGQISNWTVDADARDYHYVCQY